MALAARHISILAATHSSIAAQIFALIATILILVWAIHYGHGLNIYSDDPDLVFNVLMAQWLFGFALFWYPGAPERTRALMAPMHAAFGVATFLLMICTAESGLIQKGGDPGAETRLVNVTGLFVLLFAVAVCVAVALPRVLAI